MRLFILLYIIFSLTIARAQTSSNPIIDDFKCAGKLTDAFEVLSEKSGLGISYKQEYVQDLICNSSYDKVKLSVILDDICKQHDLSYTVHNQTVAIKPLYRKYTVYGLALNAETSERISDASVYVVGADKPVYTDQNGYFRTVVTKDTGTIIIEARDYQKVELELSFSDDKYIVVYIQEMGVLGQVKVKSSVTSPSFKNYDVILSSRETMPSVGGENDALNSLKLLSGVQNVSFGESGLIVRGGGPDQNLVLLDGIPVYNTFHILGLYSIFNSNAINNVKVFKDIYPSKYSSRLSSVVDVGLNNGNKKEWHADLDVGIISSGLHIDGPLIKDKVSISGALRRSYADLLVQPVENNINRSQLQKNSTGLWFYDGYLKLHSTINKHNEVSVSYYNGGDQLRFNNSFQLPDSLSTTEVTEGNLGWRNRLLGGLWHKKFGSKLFMSVRAASSAYSVTFEDSYSFTQTNNFAISKSSFTSGLQENRGSIDFDYFLNAKNHFLFGGGAVNYAFEPFSRNYSSSSPLYFSDTTIQIAPISSNEYFGYAENKAYFKNGSVTFGARAVYFNQDTASYFRFQPRVLFKQNLRKNYQLVFGLSTIDQFVHLVPNNNLGLPMDIWMPVAQNIKPLNVEQINMGVNGAFPKWSFKASVFSKTYKNLLEFKNGVNLLYDSASWNTGFSSGTGRSYGTEWQAKADVGNWKLFSSYTYCRSLRTSANINEGQEYYSKYDRPHTFNIQGRYQINPSSTFTILFAYSSGNPISIPSSRYTTLINGNEIVVEEFNKINNFRLPATHHLDIAYQKKWFTEKTESSIVIGVYNMYNQLNPFMVYLGVDEDINPVLKVRSYLPLMPMFKYRIKI